MPAQKSACAGDEYRFQERYFFPGLADGEDVDINS
jgi:hypothetical protein